DVPLASLDLAKMRVQAGGGRGGQQTVAQANKSIDGNPIRIGGRVFTEGVGTRTTSVLFVKLGGGADRFSASVGADDNPLPPPATPTAQPLAPPPPIPIVFRVVGDGRVLHVSKTVGRVRRRVAGQKARRSRRRTGTDRRRWAGREDAGPTSQARRRKPRGRRQ